MLTLTMKLQEFAQTCRGRARTLRDEAALIRSEPHASNYAEYNRVLDQRAVDLESQATAWEARAQAADGGRMLVDPDDVKFQMDYRGLIAEAQAECRCVYALPAQTPAYI